MRRARSGLSLQVAALWAGAFLCASASAEPPRRYTPLDAAERDAALAVVQTRTAQSRAAESQAPAAAGAATATSPGLEVLLVERHQTSKQAYASGSTSRRADVYVYDYANDTLRHSVVEVGTGAVHAETVVQGVQLPLTQAEVERALGIAYGDPATRGVLESRYRALGGGVLEGIEQLQVKAFVFRADSMPEGLNESSRSCGVHRCAQLLLFTADRVVLEVQPIVDLSRGVVTQRVGF